MIGTFERVAGPRLVALTVMLCLHALSLPFAREQWIAGISASFAPQALAASLVCGLGCALARRPRWTALALVVALSEGAAVAAVAGPVPGASTTATNPAAELTILQWNVHSGNIAREHAVRWIAGNAANLDVIVLLEITPGWVDALAPLIATYPHVRIEPRGDNFGIGVLSRLPGSSLFTRTAGGLAPPEIVLDAPPGPGRGALRLVATHPVPPLGRAATAARDAQITALSRHATGRARALIIAGDLNATPWSGSVVTLRRAAGLADAQRGHGPAPTWAPGLIPTWLGVPLDLTLVSDWLAVHRRSRGPALGSDHVPVTTWIAWPTQPP